MSNPKAETLKYVPRHAPTVVWCGLNLVVSDAKPSVLPPGRGVRSTKASSAERHDMLGVHPQP